VQFPQEEHPDFVDRSYDTIIGWSTNHTGFKYAKNDNNYSQCSARLLSKREPQIPGYDEYLRRNQRDYLVSQAAIDLNLLMLLKYEKHFSTYSEFITEALEHHADPHSKRDLRISAWNELVLSGGYAHPVWVYDIQLSFKRNEVSKPGKYARMYANLGITSSLQGAWLMDRLKEAQAMEPIHIHGGEIEFVKAPRKTMLRRTFEKLIDPPGRFYACVFSDDSCLSVRDGDKVFMYNLDISSCDTSHEPKLFESMQSVMPQYLQEEFANLIRQCEKPCVLRSITNRRNKIKLKPKGAFLPSGSVLTTSLNTFACIHFIANIMSKEFKGEVTIRDGAAECGYIVTVEHCETYHNLQFLKHSPCYDTNGRLQPVLNVGVMLRSSGVVRGDLPGKRKIPLCVRARNYQAGYLQSMYPYTRFDLLDQMLTTVGKTTREVRAYFDREKRYLASEDDEKQIFRVDDDELYKRYELSPIDMDMLNFEFGRIGFEESCTNAAIGKILNRDYGLACLWGG